MFGQNEADFTEDIPIPRGKRDDGGDEQEDNKVFTLVIDKLEERYDLGKF